MDNKLYTVRLSESREKEFAGALIEARFTFSHSHVAGFKVNINMADSVRVREFCCILHRFKARARASEIRQRMTN